MVGGGEVSHRGGVEVDDGEEGVFHRDGEVEEDGVVGDEEVCHRDAEEGVFHRDEEVEERGVVGDGVDGDEQVFHHFGKNPHLPQHHKSVYSGYDFLYLLVKTRSDAVDDLHFHDEIPSPGGGEGLL